MLPDNSRREEIQSMIKLHKKMMNLVTEGFAQLYKNQSLCDFTIVTSDGKRFGVHKVYMAVVSDYFKAMFESGMVESRSDTVTLHNVESKGLEGVLSYLYTGVTPTLILDNVKEIMNAAALLLLPDLVQHCAIFLGRKITITKSNVIEWMDIWNMYSLSYPDMFASRTLRTKILDLLEVSLFDLAEGDLHIMVPELNQDYLRALLYSWSCMKIDIDLKYLYEFMETWLQGDIERRSTQLHDTLKDIFLFNIGLMPMEQLKACMEGSTLAEVPFMREILSDIFEYHALPMYQQAGIAYKEYFRIIKVPCDLVILSKRVNDVNDKKKLCQDPGMFAYNQLLALRHEKTTQTNEGVNNKWKWFSLKVPVPENLYSIDVVSVNNFMMVGNKDNGDCHIFDPRFLKWEKVETLSKRGRIHTNFKLVGTESDLFAIGGRIGSTVTDVIKKFSWQTNKWQNIGRLPEPVENVAGIAPWASGAVYVAGGKCGPNEEYTSDMFCTFEEDGKNIQSLAPMPVRFNDTPYICKLENRIVVQDRQVHSGTQLAMYDVTSAQWHLYDTGINPSPPLEFCQKGKFQIIEGFYTLLVSTKDDIELEPDDAVYDVGVNHLGKIATIPKKHFYNRGSLLTLINTKERQTAL